MLSYINIKEAHPCLDGLIPNDTGESGLEFCQGGRKMDVKDFGGVGCGEGAGSAAVRAMEDEMSEINFASLDTTILSFSMPSTVVYNNPDDEVKDATEVFLIAAKQMYNNVKLLSCLNLYDDIFRLTLSVNPFPKNAKEKFAAMDDLNSLVIKTHPQYIGYFALRFKDFNDEN